MKNNSSLIKLSVEQLENKNQFVIWLKDKDNNNIVAFQSYKTLIAVYYEGSYEEKRPNILEVNWSMWDYSKTTLKHLKLFVNKYTTFHYENKHQFGQEIRSNKDILVFDV